MSQVIHRRHGAGDWLLAAGIAALWLLAHPYTGIRHDGRLYLGQALARLDPETFSHDLFFAFGSQDRFTLFSPLYALAVNALGVPLAAQLLLLASQLAFLVSAMLLARRLFPGMLAWLALAAVAAFPGGYGPRAILAYGEPFLTARSFAEPLVLLGLWLLLANRTLRAAGCIVVAGLLHPLLAAPAALAAWIFLALADRRWWWAGLAGLVLPLLALVGLEPFSRLFLTYDPAWRSIVKSGLAFIFPSTWSVQDWVNLGFDASVVLLATRVADAAAGRMFWALAGATGFGVLASFVGADLLSNVLLASAQLWRSAWLLHLAALLALPAVLVWLWHAGDNGRAAAALLLAAFFCLRHAAAAIVIAAALGFALAVTRPPALQAGMLRLVLGVAALLSCLGMVDQLSLILTQHRVMQLLDARRLAEKFVVYPVWLAIGFGALLWTVRRARGWPVLPVVLVSFALVGGAMLADRRLAWNRFVEEGGTAPDFLRVVGRREQVYWRDELVGVWLMLGRPSYYSAAQSSALTFDRAAALESRQRRSALADLHRQEEMCEVLAEATGRQDSCVIEPAVLRRTCAGASGLAHIVLPQRVAGLPNVAWDSGPAGGRTYHLYSCRALGRG